MNDGRRNLLRGLAFAGSGFLANRRSEAQHEHHATTAEPASDVPRQETANDAAFLPVATPDVPKLPYELDNGVKVFHLIAEPVKTEFLPGRPVDAWGYNGSIPGPTIEVVEGDRVRIIVDNHLPELTSMHWHGFEIPIEMDGVPGISQDPILPGGRFVYEFTLHQKGTFFYHSHMPMQEMMGMIGLFIMHPRRAYRPRIDKDFGIILQEWAILPNNTVPNTLSMEFNWLTLNGKSGPATTPLIVKQGDRVRIRLVNLGMDHHPMHLHGHQFYITGTEGGRVPETAWYPTNTALVGVAQAKDIEFDAVYPGDWMFHCHLPHHMMNQMVSMVGPMTHLGSGMHSGLGMEEGMGIIRDAHALSEDLGPSMGRAIGLPNRERETTHLVGREGTSQHQHAESQQAQDPWRVPGYPQDMWMTMDEMVQKPETHGLRPGWTGAMMGMMTLVRVLPEEMYEKVMALVREGRSESPAPPAHRHRG
jgi:FtsP/CotA-like multicopper oxidase with cupredoxin domain